MPNILIIAPHYPPSNLAAVHRTRLFAQHLPDMGWLPVVLTVHEQFYEEKLDYQLTRLLPAGQRIEKVSAFGVSKPRLIGDIGLRAFFQLYKRALELIRSESIDFVYIPIPSFYTALLGRLLHRQTGVKYGIDYIDPWVHIFPGSQRRFSRHWFSTLLAKILEPIAVKNAALITGVAEGYYQGVVDRNPQLVHSCRFAAMPYGGEPNDHAKAAELGAKPFLFAPHSDKIRLVYAGAFLPKSIEPLKAMLRAMASDPQAYENLEIHFIGTGVRRAGGLEPTVRPIAREFGLEGSVIFEHPERLPYFDVLTHLNAASGVFILGSTEPHYTPSKVYQAVLSSKYILAILHAKSTAVDVLRRARAGEVLAFEGENDLDRIETSWPAIYRQYTQQLSVFDPAQRNLAAFEPYSAKVVTRKLADVLNGVIS